MTAVGPVGDAKLDAILRNAAAAAVRAAWYLMVRHVVVVRLVVPAQRALCNRYGVVFMIC